MAKASGTRVTAVLWLTAAVLALSAAVVAYSRRGDIQWALLAAAVFLAANGFQRVAAVKIRGRLT